MTTEQEVQEYQEAMREVKAIKYLNSLNLEAPDDEVAKGTTAPYLESVIDNWNQFFIKYSLDYKMEMHEFNLDTYFVFIDYSKGTMLKGTSILNMFSPYQLVQLALSIYQAYNKKTGKDLTGYGVMKRKEFAGNPLKQPDYIGIKCYWGKVQGGYLIDRKGTRHALNSNYVILFKHFDSEKDMQAYLNH